MRQLQNDPEKNVLSTKTIAQICRLTVYLLMDELIYGNRARAHENQHHS